MGKNEHMDMSQMGCNRLRNIDDINYSYKNSGDMNVNGLHDISYLRIKHERLKLRSELIIKLILIWEKECLVLDGRTVMSSRVRIHY